MMDEVDLPPQLAVTGLETQGDLWSLLPLHPQLVTSSLILPSNPSTLCWLSPSYLHPFLDDPLLTFPSILSAQHTE